MSQDEGMFVLDVNASDFAMEAVLQQVQGNALRVIGYSSHIFSACEKKYCITRKKLAAIGFHTSTGTHLSTLVPFAPGSDTIVKQPIVQERGYVNTMTMHAGSRQQKDLVSVHTSVTLPDRSTVSVPLTIMFQRRRKKVRHDANV